jgi:hypothetical protein
LGEWWGSSELNGRMVGKFKANWENGGEEWGKLKSVGKYRANWENDGEV